MRPTGSFQKRFSGKTVSNEANHQDLYAAVGITDEDSFGSVQKNHVYKPSASTQHRQELARTAGIPHKAINPVRAAAKIVSADKNGQRNNCLFRYFQNGGLTSERWTCWNRNVVFPSQCGSSVCVCGQTRVIYGIKLKVNEKTEVIVLVGLFLSQNPCYWGESSRSILWQIWTQNMKI